MLRVMQADFQGDHNLGLFSKASDKLCLTGNVMTEKDLEKVSSMLGVPVITASISDTHLCGIFIAMNSNGVILPRTVHEHEVSKIKELGRKFGFRVCVLDSKYTATGNLVLCNDNGAIVSKLFSKKDSEKIGDCLGVEVANSTVAKMDTVGSGGIATNKGCLLHRDAEEEEIKLVKDVLKVDVDIGTANFGSPFVGSCVVANSNGCVAGLSTTGYEINRIMETLKFL